MKPTKSIPTGNSQSGKRMWALSNLSLETATRIGDIANLALLGSLVTGVIATFFIVQTANVKEGRWEQDREAAKLRISELDNETKRLSAEAQGAKSQIAEANAKQAIAERRTAELNLFLQQLTTWRTIDAAQIAEISKAISRFAGTSFTMAITIGDLETQTLAEQIEAALEGAGWTETSWKGQAVQFTRIDKPSIGFISATGVIIRVHASHEPPLREAIAAFVAGLNAIGIEAVTLQWSNPDPNEDVVQVLVGKKLVPLLPSSP